MIRERYEDYYLDRDLGSARESFVADGFTEEIEIESGACLKAIREILDHEGMKYRYFIKHAGKRGSDINIIKLFLYKCDHDERVADIIHLINLEELTDVFPGIKSQALGVYLQGEEN